MEKVLVTGKACSSTQVLNQYLTQCLATTLARTTTRAIAATVLLLLATAPALAGLSFPTAKKDGSPDRRRGAGSRDPGASCIVPSQADGPAPALFALAPDSNQSVTTAARPDFFWYMPATDGGEVTFVLRETEGQQPLVYSATFPAKGQEGIVRLSLPSGLGAIELAPNKAYQWSVSLDCQPGDQQSFKQTFTSRIQRLAPDAALAAQLKVASSPKLPELYAENGIWNDSLSALVDLQCSAATRDQGLEDWAGLLTSVDLAYFAQVPMLEDCGCACP